VLAGLFFSGCTVFRGERKSAPAKEYTKELSLIGVVESNLTNTDFTIQKAEIQYLDERSEVNIIASARHKADNKYLVSLRTRTGIEIARIFISEDTLLLNDRINKKLYCGSPEYLEKKYGISLDALPLVFGDLIMEWKTEEPVLCKEGRSRIMAFIGSREVNYLLDCIEKKVTAISMKNENAENHIEITLGGFQSIGKKVYPGIIEITESIGQSKIKIEIKKIEFNAIDNLNFIPGVNYEKVVVK
jgi:hypothetical protein